MSNEQQVPNEVLTSIYIRLGDLQADIASLHATTIAHEDKLSGLAHKLDAMEEDIKGLSTQAAKNSVKWAVLTFAATTLLITGVNHAIGEDALPPFVMMPSNKEINVRPLWEFD